MSWLLIALGLGIAVLGSAGAVALVATAREALKEAISRRLRGGTSRSRGSRRPSGWS